MIYRSVNLPTTCDLPLKFSKIFRSIYRIENEKKKIRAEKNRFWP